MPSGTFSGGPCDGCGFHAECARSHWSCRAFNRYVNNTGWKPEMRGPTIKATRAFLARNQEARQQEKREQDLKQRREWYALNRDRIRPPKRVRLSAEAKRERIREQKRLASRASRARDPDWPRKNREQAARYYREKISTDPAAYARLKARQQRWSEANRERVREQKNAAQRRRRAAAKAAKEVPAADPVTEVRMGIAPAGSAGLTGGALLQ